MGNLQCVNPEQLLLRELLGGRVARLIVSAPGGWRTLHERELLALGLSETSCRALLALQQLTSSAWPSLAIGSLVSADKVAAVYTERLGNLRHEVVLGVALDCRNHFIEEHTLAMGGAHGAALTAPDVFRPLIRAGGSGLVLVQTQARRYCHDPSGGRRRRSARRPTARSHHRRRARWRLGIGIRTRSH